MTFCVRCQTEKPDTEFNLNETSWCRICRNAYQVAYYHKRKAYRIAHNRKHLAISRGSPKETAELIYVDVLFDRDKGICQICCQPCIREDASMDHIIPCTEHGPHTYANTRLAHVKCNQVDGAYKQHARQRGEA